MTQEQPEWSILDGNRLSNALSILMVGCLIPKDPFGEQLYLTLSTAAFVASATINHLYPERFKSLTHGVKAAYTNVLAASLPTPSLWIPAIVSLFDLAPLVMREPRLQRWAALAEGVGGAVRWLAIGYAFYLLKFPLLLSSVFVACSAAYFWERRQRIARGRRHEYGIVHSLEHIGVWLLLIHLNSERLNLPLVWGLSATLILTLASALVAIGIVVNVRLSSSLLQRLPAWFDPNLRPAIEEKSRANLFSHRWQHYIIKPFTPKTTSRCVRWKDIERMVDSVEFEGTFDVVVGVLSGGGFISNYVAKRLGVEHVAYVRSRYWSELPLWRSSLRTVAYYLGMRAKTEAKFMQPETSLAGKRVLVVDDSVCTGISMATVVAQCRERGASEVRTFTLFCHPAHPTDHYCRLALTPMIWPWGWESD